MNTTNDWETISSDSQHDSKSGISASESLGKMIEIDFSKIKSVIQNDQDDDFKRMRLKRAAQTIKLENCPEEEKTAAGRKLIKFMLDGNEQEYECILNPKIGTAMYLQIGKDTKKYVGQNTNQILVTRKSVAQNTVSGSKRKAEDASGSASASKRIKTSYTALNIASQSNRGIDQYKKMLKPRRLDKPRKSVKRYTKIVVKALADEEI
ncbi:unnamed protein product [Moneuplotes crassus]|uniref:Uncharacterized protein n=1 Tax=Euplotes crassus TaxID=5936 RepID=A0AAD1XU00_EUPCR|nr:unnamed protein product [Moneuplotes crassus]